jgi:hypothetical protein
MSDGTTIHTLPCFINLQRQHAIFNEHDFINATSTLHYTDPTSTPT